MVTIFQCCKKGFASVDEEILLKTKGSLRGIFFPMFARLIVDNGAER